MENLNTSLRQSDNILQIEGVLSEKNLTIEPSKLDQRISVIRGSLVLKTDDTNFVTVQVYEPSHYADKNSGLLNINNAYEGLHTVMNTYKSISEVGEDQATKVRFRRGTLQPRTYIDPATKERRVTVAYRNRYFSQAIGTYEPQATFSVEGYINKMREEFVGGEATGRIVIELLVSDYKGGVEPLEVYVPTILAQEFESTYNVQDTLTVYGEIKSNVVVTENKIGVAFGVSKNKTGPSRKVELVLTGASSAYEDERAFNPMTVKAALVERESRLEREAATITNQPEVKTPGASYMGAGVRKAPQMNAGW